MSGGPFTGSSPNDDPREFFIHQTYDEGGKRVTVASRADMEATNLPLQLRDYCAHLAIDFAYCRDSKASNLLPNSCHHEMLRWERCEWEETRRRIKEKQALKEHNKKYGL